MRSLIGLLMVVAVVSVRAQAPSNVEQLPALGDILKQLAQPPAPGAPDAVPPAAASSVSAPSKALEDLLGKDRHGIEKLYRGLKPGPIPDGESNGRATLDAGTAAGRQQEEMLSRFWTGKIFHRVDAEHGQLVNKVLGKPQIPADVFYGVSRLDGKKSIILDYSKSPDALIKGIRDEIRLVSPGVYVGYAYIHTPLGWLDKPIIFALDFNK